MVSLGFFFKRANTHPVTTNIYNKNTRSDKKSDEQDKNRTYKNISYTAC